MSIGTQFRQAREAKRVSLSEAAAAIRTKIQQVEALEADNFERFASPVYARGFIKLYAEYLGLDPAPLLREYAERHAPSTRAPILPPAVALTPRRTRMTVTEDGVVEKSGEALASSAAMVAAEVPATAPSPVIESTAPATEISGPAPAVRAAPDIPPAEAASTAPQVTRSRWALAAALLVAIAAVTVGVVVAGRRGVTPKPVPQPMPSLKAEREIVSPLLETPPEPLLDPLAAHGAGSAP